jgi:hypothetical protein
VLPARVTPELQYLEAKFAGLVSYGLSATLLAELLPLGRPLHATAVRHHVQALIRKPSRGRANGTTGSACVIC